MKNLYLILLLPILLAACSKPTNKTWDDYGISHFDYDGHAYIAFERTTGYQGYLGVVHDPDCECRK